MAGGASDERKLAGVRHRTIFRWSDVGVYFTLSPSLRRVGEDVSLDPTWLQSVFMAVLSRPLSLACESIVVDWRLWLPSQYACAE